MSQEDIIDDVLLAKFLAGEATPEEAMLVTDWIEKSNENKLLFDQSQQAWALQEENLLAPADKSKILNSITSRKPSSRSVSFFTPLRMAASLLVLVAVGSAFYFMNLDSSKEEDWITTNSKEEVAKFTLVEGSSISLNRKSQLTYPKEFNGETRTVKLSGEAFFDVTHNQAQPFIVVCDEINIKVLGTAFNISNSSGSPTIETQVTRGKVAMYNRTESIQIEAGWTGIYDKSTKKLTLKKAKSENRIGYATHTFTFEDTSLKQVTDNLASSYGVSFVFENEKLKDCHLTSSYENKSLSFILEVIAESLNVRYTVKGNIVYLSGDGCM